MISGFCHLRPPDPETGRRRGHHWVLDGLSRGTCRYCGAIRQFKHEMTEEDLAMLASMSYTAERDAVEWDIWGNVGMQARHCPNCGRLLGNWRTGRFCSIHKGKSITVSGDAYVEIVCPMATCRCKCRLYLDIGDLMVYNDGE